MIGEPMPHVYRISKGPDVGDTVASIDAIEAFVRDHGPGRYQVDEISRDTLPSGHTRRRWGVGIKHADGTVVVEPDPWDA
jgi:hypothetical protein